VSLKQVKDLKSPKHDSMMYDVEDPLRDQMQNNHSYQEGDSEQFEQVFNKKLRQSSVKPKNDAVLQASSPDEIALVRYAIELDMVLKERERTRVVIQNPLGVLEEYMVLANFPFTSESKKMSILVKHFKTGKIIYYVKGAEVVMEEKIKPAARAPLLEYCENLAMDGLRTLVFAQKVLTEEELE
jgi:magnesium-transporting ATPase (P-type)